MQEHFPAGAWIARHLKTKRVVGTGTPKMQEQFSARANQSTIPKNEELPVCRKCRSKFRLTGNDTYAGNAEALSGEARDASPQRPGRAKFMQMVYAAAQVNRA